MRHLLRWHWQVPDAPDVWTVALATALVMAFVTIPQSGLVKDAPEAPSTLVAPSTDVDRPTDSLVAISRGVLADVRWRVVRPVRPTSAPVPAAMVPGCDPVAVGLAQEGADSVSRAELATLLAATEPVQVSLTLDPDCPTASAQLSWYLNAHEQAAAVRAARPAAQADQRRVARAEQQRQGRQAKQLAARRTARHRAAERAAAKRAATQRAEARRAAQRRAAKRAAAKRAAAGRAAASRPGGGTASGSWRNAPIVTWYGPGFYGNRTACGVRYTRTVVGVAHRTLPCGTLVRFKWRGITAVAPVIDRGPYASAAYVFDFSAALSCKVFKPKGVRNACFTRHDVRYQVVGKVDLQRYLATHGH